MKTEFILKLFDDEKMRNKLTIMNCLEAMLDDERNVLPEEYYYFTDNIPLGKSIKITFELID